MSYPPRPARTDRGFTLIEMSIVLMIIALVTAGIFVSKSLIRAAELRSIIADATNYSAAVSNFRTQYRGLPGDITNASNYWASATNGNGDNMVTGAERFQFWYQLNQAGFIEQTVTGVQGAGGSEDFVMGSNTPTARALNGGFAAYTPNLSASTTTTYTVPNAGTTITLGAAVGSNLGPPTGRMLFPSDAYTIDLKVDDGVPGTGKWIANLNSAQFGWANACTTDYTGDSYTGGYNYPGAGYNLSLQRAACSFFILTGY